MEFYCLMCNVITKHHVKQDGIGCAYVADAKCRDCGTTVYLQEGDKVIIDNTKTKRINNLRELRDAAYNKRAVFNPRTHTYNKPKPAAFVLNMCGSVLLYLFLNGMYIYEKPTKKKRGKKKRGKNK